WPPVQCSRMSKLSLLPSQSPRSRQALRSAAIVACRVVDQLRNRRCVVLKIPEVGPVTLGFATTGAGPHGAHCAYGSRSAGDADGPPPPPPYAGHGGPLLRVALYRGARLGDRVGRVVRCLLRPAGRGRDGRGGARRRDR